VAKKHGREREKNQKKQLQLREKTKCQIKKWLIISSLDVSQLLL
jgi:hypothetical protein